MIADLSPASVFSHNPIRAGPRTHPASREESRGRTAQPRATSRAGPRTSIERGVRQLNLVFLLVCALPVVAGASTSVQFIEVTARQDWVLSGRTLQLEARAMNLYGATLSNVTLAWQSSNRAVAEVDNAGRVRGLLPGKANITASAGSVSGAFTVAVHPARMEIDPGNPELRVGEKVTLTAQAFDADGNPLAGLRFSWSSGQPGVASVSTQGEVLGRAEASTTIAASLDIADLLPGFSAQTTVAVRGAGDFALERLISNEFETRPVVLRNIGEMSHAGNDQVVFDTALSNGSQALMAWDNGVLEAVAFSGQYLDDLGLVVERFERMSVNARGDVLTRTFFPSHPWDGLVLFRRESSGLVPVLVTLPSSFCCPEVSSFGLGEDGEAVFTAIDEAGWRHLFLRTNGGDLNTVAVAGAQLPGFGVPDWIGDAAMFRRGEIVFNANGQRGYGYFHWDGVEVRKIYATGDSILGRRIGDGERPIQTASGDFYVRMWGNDFDLVAQLSGGEWSAVVESGQRLDGMDIHSLQQFHDARDDTVLFAADTDQGSGLFTLAGSRLTKLAGFGEAPSEWRWIHQAFLRSAGGAIVMGPQGEPDLTDRATRWWCLYHGRSNRGKPRCGRADFPGLAESRCRKGCFNPGCGHEHWVLGERRQGFHPDGSLSRGHSAGRKGNGSGLREGLQP